MQLTVSFLREIFRNLAPFRALYESDGIDTITDPDGVSWSLWDIEYLFGVSQQILPIRQRQAIRLCLLNNLSEQDAAKVMKIDESNPVAMYATSGLEELIHMYKFDLLPTRAQYFAQLARSQVRAIPLRQPKRVGVFIAEKVLVQELLNDIDERFVSIY